MTFAYKNYWKRKRMLSAEPPAFPAIRWHPSEGLCDSERIIFDSIREASSLLDVGAGDLRVMRKFLAAGFAGTYHTRDIGTEFAYTYQNINKCT